MKDISPSLKSLPPDYQKFHRECKLPKEQEKEARQLYARAAFYDLEILQVSNQNKIHNT